MSTAITPTGSVTLAASDHDRIRAAIRSSRSPNTRRAYASQWKHFTAWAATREHPALPAAPEVVAAYLADRAADGIRPDTLKQACAAIGQAHREAGHVNPCASEGVRRTLAGLVREMGCAPRQAAGLTENDLSAICATAHHPRDIGRGRKETAATADRRATVDVALVRTMRDGLLRRSEAAAITWADIATEPDGSGRVTIRRSKTDQESEGAVLYLAQPTMQALAAIRNDAPDDARVFSLSAAQIARRIASAARAAGLAGRFSGHSARVGMAQDLARAGTELPALMQAGRWESPTMPAAYTRNEQAGRGAVARYYRTRQP